MSSDMFAFFNKKLNELISQNVDFSQNPICQIFSTFLLTNDQEDFLESLLLIYEEDYKLRLSTNKIDLSSEESSNDSIPEDNNVSQKKVQRVIQGLPPISQFDSNSQTEDKQIKQEINKQRSDLFSFARKSLKGISKDPKKKDSAKDEDYRSMSSDHNNPQSGTMSPLRQDQNMNFVQFYQSEKTN